MTRPQLRPSRYRSLSLNPRRARPPATTRAIQLTHIGMDQSPMVTVHSMKIRTRWNSATTTKISPATSENVFASMSHHPKFLTQDSTQGAGGCERRANVIPRRAAPMPLAGLDAAWRQVHRHAPHRRGSEGADRADSAEHRVAFRADETGRQQMTSAGHQTYRHARASTMTTRTIIKFISAHKLSVRLSPLLSMTNDCPSRLDSA